MSSKVRCHHGHRVQLPPDARERAICPLCGSVIRLKSSDTVGRGSLDDTVNLPGADDPPRATDANATDTLVGSHTLGSDAGDDGTCQTANLDGTLPESGVTHSGSMAHTMDFSAPQAPTDEDESEPSIHTARTMLFNKTLHLDGTISEPEEEGEFGKATRTVAFDKTIADGVPESMDDAGPATMDLVEPADRGSDGGISPTIVLDTLDAEPPKPTPQLDQRGGRNRPPPPKKTGQAGEGRDEHEPPNLPGYSVISELGRGGMGVVYRARHERHNRDVALKTLLHISPVELQRFKQEFRSLADIAHPNLAGLYDLLSDGETWCFSMEILEAVDFNEYVWSGFEALRRNERVTPATQASDGAPRLTAEIQERLFEGLKQLALGLNALHQAGMLHRDIKPSNVLVTTEGRVVLVDFGLASVFEEGSDERPQGIQGTPEYMAPEQAACNPISPATDWYAVGVMIYEILTGGWPIQGTPLKIIFKKQKETPREARELEPTIPAELNDLCMKLLAKDAADRPTVADVLRCIEAEDLIETLQAPTLAGAGTDLVGREGHLAGLSKSFKQVIDGTTKSLFVHGKSGMGKSVLIQKFLDGVREQKQAVVLNGRCYEQESVPFKALDSLIDSLAAHIVRLPEPEVRALTPKDSLPLVRLFPVLGQIPGVSDPGKPSIQNVDQQELRQRAMNALRELLKRLGDRQPLVLYIDDLQWGDEDSADLLADLVRPPDAPRMMVLGSYRTENRDTSVCLKALATAYTTGQQHPHREEIAVDSLQEADAKRLALMLLGRHDAATQELAGKIARESGGWPFFVWELAQHVQDDPDIADKSLELDEVIWTRVNRLPEEARHLLELVAVTARPIPASEAYQAMDAMEKGQGFLAQLRTNNFVRSTESEDEDTMVEAYHDRIRESVVHHLDKATIQGHSLNLALTIEKVSGIQVADLRAHIDKTAEYDVPSEPYVLPKQQWQRVFDLAYFFDAASEHKRAFPFALIAAEQARKQDAQEVAEQQYRIALRGAAHASPAIRFRVQEGLGDVFVLRGKYDEAKEQFDAARSVASDELALARLDWKLGEASFKKGDVGDARDYSEKALRALGERPPSPLTVLPRALKEAVVQVLHSKLPSIFVGRRAADSPAAKLDLFLARIYDQLTFSYWFSAGMNFVLWSHLRQMNLAERYPPSPELGRTYAFHAITMTGLPMAERGIKYAERAYEISVNDGDLWGQGKARSFHTFACIVLARFREGLQTGTEAVRLLEEAGDVWEANMARMIATVPVYHLGNLKTAYQQSRKAYEIAVECGDYSGVCISLLFWAPSSPHTLPPGAIQKEMERDREDPVTIAGAVYARGLELLLSEDNPREAAVVLQESLDRAKKRGVRNVCLFSAATWKATALRIAAEREDGSARRLILRDADRAVRAALSITKSYRACRPHALREAGLIAALEGKEDVASRFFEQSLQLATEYEARYDHARTSLARAEAGIKFGWPDAEQQVADARAVIEEIENVEEE